MYLAEYRFRLNAMSSQSGYTCRLLYSPVSKTVSVNYFSIKRPHTNASLMQELSAYKENYTFTGLNDNMYSGEPVSLSNLQFEKR